MTKRRFSYARQAYMPSVWPLLLLAIPFTVIISFLDPNPFISALAGGVIGLLVVNVRWRIWQRRHPVLAPEERIQALRDQATWN